MDTKLIEDFETELVAHSAALEKAAELCEAQAARIKELEAENIEAADHVGRAEMAEAAMKADRDAERTVKNSVIKNYDIALEGKAVLKRERDEARSERDALKVALRMLRNAALKHKMDKDDLEIDDANALLGLASESKSVAEWAAENGIMGADESHKWDVSTPAIDVLFEKNGGTRPTLADASESHCEAAGKADEKPDGQAENAIAHTPAANEL